VAIREARPADSPRLLALQAHLRRPSPDLLSAALSGIGTVLVSTDEGRPVGYVLAVPGGGVVHVAEVAVSTDHRREGRASRLLARLVARRPDARFRLAVEPENEPARRCYERAGFEAVDLAPDYFDGDPAVIMVRSAGDGS